MRTPKITNQILAKIFTFALVVAIAIPSSIIARPFITDPEIRVYPDNEVIVFSETRVGETRTEFFTIENISDTNRTIVVTSLPQAPFSYTSSTNLEVTANSTRSFAVNFSPAQAGTFSSTLTIRNASTNESKILTLQGTATGAHQNLGIEVSTNRVNFPRTMVGETAQTNLTVTNRNNFPVNISTNLQNNPTQNPYQVGISPQTLNAGESYTQTVNFIPRQTGTFTNTLFIRADSPHGNTSQSIRLNGEAIAMLTPDNPELQIQGGNTIDFGNVPQGQSIYQTIQLRNNGTTSIDVEMIRFTQTPFTSDLGGTDFYFVTINPGQSRNLRVRFAPTLPGNFASEVTIRTTASNVPTRTFQVRGNSLPTNTNPQSLNVLTYANPSTITASTPNARIFFTTNQQATTSVRILRNNTVVKTLTTQQTNAGQEYSLIWDATNTRNQQVANGTYTFEVSASNRSNVTARNSGTITVNLPPSPIFDQDPTVTVSRRTINPDLNEVAYLNFTNPVSQNVRLEVYDNRNNQLIFSQDYGTQPAGQNNWRVSWNGRNFANNRVSAGSFTYVLHRGLTQTSGTLNVVRNQNHNPENFVLYFNPDVYYQDYNFRPHTINNELLITGLTVSPKVLAQHNAFVYASFNLLHNAPVTANILDSQRRLVTTVKRNMPTTAGYHRNLIEWNGLVNGQPVSNGQYYFEVTTARLGESDSDVVAFTLNRPTQMPKVETKPEPIGPAFNYYYYTQPKTTLPRLVTCLDYVDVESGTEFCNAVQLATQEQIFKGHTDRNGVKTMKPDDFVTRAEAATIIVRVLGLNPANYNPNLDGNLGFKDLNPT